MLQYDSIGSFVGFKAHEFVAHWDKTNCVAIGPRSGQVLATGGDDKRVNVWRIGRASSIWSLTGNSSAIESVCFDPTEEFLVSGSAGGAVKLFDLSAGKMTRHFRGHMCNVTVVDCGSFDRRFVTTGSMDCQVKLWNVDTKECAMGFKGHTAEITDVQFSPDGYILASAAADGQVKLWDLRAGKPMHTFQACSGPVRALRFNPQEFLLAAATSDRTVKLYDIEFMELFCATAPDTTPTRAVTFDPDGQRMYCASPSGVKRWSWDNDTATAKLEAMGDVAWGKVGAGAFHYNSDGRQLLAGACANKRVSVWAVDVYADTSPKVRQTGTSALASGGNPGESTFSSPALTCGSAVVVAADSRNASEIGSRNSLEDAVRKGVTRFAGDPSREWAGNDHDRDTGRNEEKDRRAESDVLTTFQVRRHQLSSSLVAEVKTSSSSPSAASIPAVLPPATMHHPLTTTVTYPVTNSTPFPPTVVGGTPSRSSGTSVSRRPSQTRAAAVAAAVAAVASAKAATDDAVASVSNSVSGRYRSIGTSVSNTLVMASAGDMDGTDGSDGRNFGVKDEGQIGEGLATRRAGTDITRVRGVEIVGEGMGVGVRAAAVRGWQSGSDPRALGEVGGGSCLALAQNTVAPGKYEEADRRRADDANGRDRCYKQRLRDPGDRGVYDSKSEGGATGGRSQCKGDGSGNNCVYDKGDPSGSKQYETAEVVPPAITTKPPWSIPPETPQTPRYKTAGDGGILEILARGGGGEGGGERGRGTVTPGTGEYSPPLLGSPSSSPARAPEQRPQSSSPPCTNTPSNDVRHQGQIHSEVSMRPSGEQDTPAAGTLSGSEVAAVQERAGRSDGWSVGSGELGMTRPRTATRRWDRPGPLGDDDVIAKTLLSSSAISATLRNRLTQLRLLRLGWAEGDISGTISRLKQLERSATDADCSPRTVVTDFLSVVPLETAASVTLEHCLELMPLLEDLWKLDAENSVSAGTRCLELVVRRFGGFVRDTLGAPLTSGGGVDLAREARICRCREAHRTFVRGYRQLERAEREFYEDRRIAAVAARLRPLFDTYFMS